MTTIALMRPPSTLAESVRLGEARGLSVLAASMMSLEPMADGRLTRFLSDSSAAQADFVVFTSSNGVSHALELASESGLSGNLRRIMDRARIVAIGAKTKRALEAQDIRVDLVPKTASSEGLVEMFTELGVKGARMVILRSAHGSEKLVSGLTALGAMVDDIPVYATGPPADAAAAEGLVRRAAQGDIDVFCFTSSMMVRNFMEIAQSLGLADQVLMRMGRAKVAAIGAPTVRTLEGYGVRAEIVPEEQTIEALLDEVVKRV